MVPGFSVGDVVQLKSGGPLMTVAQIGELYDDNVFYAWCDWFVQDKAPWKRENHVFTLASLRKAGDPR